MNDEDSFEAVQYIPVLKTDFIMKSTLNKELCDALIKLSEQKIETGIVDNLEGVRRTGWDLQKDSDVEHLQMVTAKVEHCISTRLNYPHFHKNRPSSMRSNGMQFVIAMYNAWVGFIKVIVLFILIVMRNLISIQSQRIFQQVAMIQV